MLTGTIINSLTILAGSAVGLVLRAVTRRSSKEVSADGLGGRLQTIIMQGMALCVLYIGVSGCLKGQNTLTAILSIALGAIIGELLDLDRRMRSLGDWVQTRTARLIHTEDGAPSISDGFVTASLLFCVGAMAIVGALENGLTGSYDTLKAKSIIDGISSIVFASSLGVGVAFSAGAIFLYQGAISLLAGLLSPLLGDAVIAEMTCVGSADRGPEPEYAERHQNQGHEPCPGYLSADFAVPVYVSFVQRGRHLCRWRPLSYSLLRFPCHGPYFALSTMAAISALGR